MKLQTLALFILAMAFIMGVCREPAGRIGLIVFITGVAEVALGLAAVMALFQTIGSIGLARGLIEHAGALAATTLVLAVGSGAMTLCLCAGVWCLRASLP